MHWVQFERDLAFWGLLRTSLAQASASKKASPIPAAFAEPIPRHNVRQKRQMNPTRIFARIVTGVIGFLFFQNTLA
jgi:hypothetical protein